jgi:hypothetical protein
MKEDDEKKNNETNLALVIGIPLGILAIIFGVFLYKVSKAKVD